MWPCCTRACMAALPKPTTLLAAGDCFQSGAGARLVILGITLRRHQTRSWLRVKHFHVLCVAVEVVSWQHTFVQPCSGITHQTRISGAKHWQAQGWEAAGCSLGGACYQLQCHCGGFQMELSAASLIKGDLFPGNRHWCCTCIAIDRTQAHPCHRQACERCILDGLPGIAGLCWRLGRPTVAPGPSTCRVGGVCTPPLNQATVWQVSHIIMRHVSGCAALGGCNSRLCWSSCPISRSRQCIGLSQQ
jgi:hypothetical protein